MLTVEHIVAKFVTKGRLPITIKNSMLLVNHANNGLVEFFLLTAQKLIFYIHRTGSNDNNMKSFCKLNQFLIIFFLLRDMPNSLFVI